MLAGKKIFSISSKASSLSRFFSKWLWITIGIYVITFGFISLWKYFNFAYNALDLAIINNVFYQTSLGQLFGSSIHPPSYLGDHFTPVIFLLIIPYLVFAAPPILLILQTFILSLTAWPIYLMAKY